MGEIVIFSAYFYLEIQEHNPTTAQQLERIPGKVKYIDITDNIIISLPILSELLLPIFLSSAVSLRHFDPYVQADTWLKEKESRAHRGAKPRPNVLSELWGTKMDEVPWTAGCTRAARAGACRAWKRLRISGSCPSWNRAGDNWAMPLQNLNVDPSLPLLALRQWVAGMVTLLPSDCSEGWSFHTCG